AAAFDTDPWVRAAAAVVGAGKRPPWEGSAAVFDRLRDANDVQHRAAAVWAASFVGDHKTVASALADPESRVRLEGLRSFAKMKADVPGSAAALIACMRDPEPDVKRAALREATRWSSPPELEADFVAALVQGLASGDREVRRLAAEALAAQPPAALAQTLPLLQGRGDSAPATIEALVRSGRPDLFEHARGHLEHQMTEGVHLARLGARISAAHHRGEDGSAQHAFLHVALDDYVDFVAESGLAAMRALHGKRGFATVERGVRSIEPGAKAEGLETLLNFGPGWLAAPLAQLLDRESFDPTTTMVTRHYMKGELVFREGDVGSELYVVLEGEIRIHLDGAGRDVTIARFGPNTVVGEMAVFDEQPRSASAEATMDTTLRVLRKDRLHVIVHEHPEVLLEFVKNLSQRLRQMDARLESS
ncbi:MAG: cyclic nucleotide-binding domain-containing protein, partial [Chloroflexi bacterium]